MALRWSLVEMPLGGGVDQYTDAPHVIPGKLTTAQNTRYREPPKVGKRWGTSSVSSTLIGGGSTITKGVRLVAQKQQTLVLDDNALYSYSDIHDRWRKLGQVSRAQLDMVGHHNDASQSSPQVANCCINQEVLAVFWYANNTNSLNVDLVDQRTGSIYHSETVAGTYVIGNALRVFALGNYAYCLSQTAAGRVGYTRIDVTSTSPAASTWANVGTVFADVQTIQFDAAPLLGTGDFLIAYARIATLAVRVERIDQSNANVNSASFGATVNAGGALAVVGTATENVYCAYTDNVTPSVDCVVLAANLSTVAGPSNMHAGAIAATKIAVGRNSATSAIVVWENPEASPDLADMRHRIIDNTGSPAASAETTTRNTSIYSKPWLYDGRVYIVAGYNDRRYFPAYGATTYNAPVHATEAANIYEDASSEPALLLLELTNGSATLGSAAQDPRWIGTCLRGQAEIGEMVAAPVDGGGTKFSLMGQARTRLLFGGDDDSTTITAVRYGLRRITIDFGSATLHQSARWGPDGRVFAGACPHFFDGRTTHEVGFSRRPENWLYTSQPTTGGHLVQGTTFKCVFVYEWEDDLGNVCRSAPSDVITQKVLAGATITNVVNYTLKEQPITNRTGGVRVVPYRTTSGASPGSVFYRDSKNGVAATYNTVIPVGQAYPDTPAAGSPVAGVTNYLEKNEVLYITGDILDNTTPPPCKTCVNHGDRIWLGGTDDAEWIWFSQPYNEGDEPRFNEGLRVYIGEPVTAMASMDDQLIVWSRSKIFLVTGQGPPATGGLDVGFQVSLISSDTGCEDWRSVVQTPQGLMFLGTKGIYLLGRGLQLEWIGAEIKSTLDTFSTITAAVVSPDTTEVLFSATRTNDSRILVYNYALQAWSVDVPPDSSILHTGAAVVHAGTAAWRLAWLQTNGTLWREDRTKWTDDSASVTWQVVTPWIKLNTLQGWQRIRKVLLLIQRLAGKNVFGLRVQAAYDYNSTSFTDTYSFSIAEITALARDQVEVLLGRQQCESVRFKITETFNDAGEVFNMPGPNLRSLVFEAGIKGRAMQLDATKARK